MQPSSSFGKGHVAFPCEGRF